MGDYYSRSGETEAIVLVKAAPVIGEKHGETVCCAGLDLHGKWLRMYPISFRVLDDGKRFKRWDKVKFHWRLPSDDHRIESRHVDNQSLEITGTMRKVDRARFLDRAIVTSLNAEYEAGRSLALLQPEIRDFRISRKGAEKLAAQQAKIDAFHAQDDMFIPRPIVPARACPYEFQYVYRTEDGDREGTCQDWETEATFFKWRNLHNEQWAIDEMRRMFGEELPERGLYFAMGTHSQYPKTWLINGLIQLQRSAQASLF